MYCKFLTLILSFLLITSIAFAQNDPILELTLKAGNCGGGKACTIKLLARESVLKKFLISERVNLTNCNYLFETPEDILKGSSPANKEKSALPGENRIIIEDAGEFLELYKMEKEGKGSAEICISSDGEISFSIGNEQGRIEISSSGKISLSGKSANGITHKVEFR